MGQENKIIISISKELKQKLEKNIEQTNFKSVKDYIAYIIEQIVSDNESDMNFKREEQPYTEEEEADIKGPMAYIIEKENEKRRNNWKIGF